MHHVRPQLLEHVPHGAGRQAGGEGPDRHRRDGVHRHAGVLGGAGRGQTTETRWPRAARHSTTRQTEVVTPLSVGRKDSVTTTMRTTPSVPPPGDGPATAGSGSGDERMTGYPRAMPEIEGFWAVVPPGAPAPGCGR